MTNWKEVTLNDIALINPIETISKGAKAKKIPMENLQPFTKKVYRFVIEEYRGGVKFRNGDTIIARITPSLENGKTSFIDILDDNEIAFGSTEFIVLRKKIGISDEHYLYYFSISPSFRDIAILSMTGSSGRQRVQIDVVKNHSFLVPPLPEQKAIASVLSSLDDKIDLLHRQNETLEKMAETLFRQWFIVEAGDDWEEKTLYDVIDLIGGGTPKTSHTEFWNGKIKWLSAKDVTENHKKYILDTEKTITDLGLNKSSTKLLPKNSTIITARGTVGKYCLLSEEMAFSQSNYGIKPKYKNCYYFTYLLISTTIDQLKQSAYGTVFDTITTNTF